MTDREKVLNGLELCFDFNPPEYIRCSKCPYNSLPKKTNCQEVMIEDVVVLLKQQAELLKEQEAVEPVFEVKNPNVVGQFHCGNCHHAFGLLHYKFCPECGRKVKWE